MTRLVIKLTAGVEALERANQAWTVGTTALAADVPVSFWLTGDAVWFATPGFSETVSLEGASPFHESVAAMIENGTLSACSQCLNRRKLTAVDLLPGVRIAGAAGFLEEILAPDIQALVY